MALISVASAAELKPSEMKVVDADGKPVLLVNLDGAYYALSNKCTHMGCSLSKGKLAGEVVQCPCHGSRFNVKTGEVVGGPAKKPEPKFNVKVENGQVVLSI